MPDTPALVKQVIAEEAKRHKVPQAWVTAHVRGGARGPADEARHAAVRRLRQLTDDAGQPLFTLAQIGDWCGVSKQRAHQIVHGRGDALSR